MKIRSVGAELFHADRRTDRHEVAFRSFSKGPQDQQSIREYCSVVISNASKNATQNIRV